MNLHDYIKPFDKQTLNSFAASCGTTAGQLKQVAYGYRRPGAALAISIERESSRAVTCEEMRPDIDWAYLRSTDPSKAAA
ncbi:MULTISPECIES: transcriptional regulator [Pseudomonas]|jgi:DNA-binding transcriptional regulator YdaS (Cro superfamily)|uniref:Helix-turn-helix domain-containing protein n=1 Tax=Pseudomonas promysalinigenes TaxID=485898 RepID=A0ABY6AQX4_9PSED|nr:MULTISPECIES: helix-turn-helix domain-containing protein [Pseudomonas]UXH41592.1 helix-turn-helix domain-containing protein [Pseudomonas promysalinigenes]WBM49070.1 helix-turn-helix domain-containing protein [Pseudomonas putida]